MQNNAQNGKILLQFCQTIELFGLVFFTFCLFYLQCFCYTLSLCYFVVGFCGTPILGQWKYIHQMAVLFGQPVRRVITLLIISSHNDHSRFVSSIILWIFSNYSLLFLSHLLRWAEQRWQISAHTVDIWYKINSIFTEFRYCCVRLKKELIHLKVRR